MLSQTSQRSAPSSTQTATRLLWCLIEGETTSFSVSSPTDINVHAFKKLVLNEGFDLTKHAAIAKDLVLRQIKQPVAIGPMNDFLERVRSLGKDKLIELDDPTKSMSDIFPEPPPTNHLHILVQRPVTGTAVAEDFAESLRIARCIYDTLWRKALDPFLCESTTNVAGTTIRYSYYKKALIDDTQLFRLKFQENILLIREEYVTVYEVVQSWSRIHQGGVVVTGQPGIGKTCFLFFILFQRLSAGLPTAFQMHENRFFLFTSQGASVFSSVSDSAYRLPIGTWALSDYNEGIVQPCGAFLDSSMDVWVVQASSPKKSRWSQWKTQRHAKLYVMDCISFPEMISLGTLLELDVNKLLKHMNIWGPSARICIDLERGRLSAAAWSSDVEVAAKQFVANPSSMMDLANGLNFTDDVPHRLLTVRPENLTPDGRETAKANIPTRYLLGYVMRALATLDIAEQTRFFTLISSHPWLRGAAGWCFEKFIHVRLVAQTSSMPLEATPAKKNSPSLIIPVCEKFHPLWGLTVLAQANRYKLPLYWRPTSTQFTSLDAIICTEEEILLLQTTISRGGLGVKPEGLEQVLDRLPKRFKSIRRVCLVFITDNEEAAVRLRNRHLPGLSSYNSTIYSSVFTVGQTPLSRKEREALENIVDKASIQSEILADPSYESCYGEIEDGHHLKVVKSKGKTVDRYLSPAQGSEMSGEVADERGDRIQMAAASSSIVAVDNVKLGTERKRKKMQGEVEKGIRLTSVDRERKRSRK